MTPEVADPLALVGTWALARVIEDRVATEQSRLDGHLDLVRESERAVRWEETATWHRPGGPVPVRRGLRLTAGEDGWWMRFEDGREFHPWTPGAAVVHECGADTYRGTVEGSLAAWRVTWEVTGPLKDYTMTTDLTPLDARPPV